MQPLWGQMHAESNGGSSRKQIDKKRTEFALSSQKYADLSNIQAQNIGLIGSLAGVPAVSARLPHLYLCRLLHRCACSF